MTAFYQLITDTDAQLAEGVTVSALYVVASLEIAIRDEDETGLALRLHSYPADINKRGYWAPPNMQYHVNRNYDAPQSIPEIVKQFRQHIAGRATNMLDDITLLAESFGLRGAVVSQVPEGLITEIKPSINSPTMINAFCTVRFALTGLNEKSEANLVDREGRHGFVLFPLDGKSISKVRNRIDIDGTGTLVSHYLGKPIISGLQRVLERHVGGVRDRAIDVSAVATRRSEHGIIVVADIAGYGRVLTSQYFGYVSSQAKEQRAFQSRVLSALERALTATGTTQVQTAGDGFLAGYPTSGDDKVTQETLVDVLQQWTDTVRLIHVEINAALAAAQNTSRLGSRIAISFGEYEWGRINGLGSFAPSFNGPAVVDTARLEQGLNRYAGEQVELGAMKGGEHLLVLDEALVRFMGAGLKKLSGLSWNDLGVVTLRAKERIIGGSRLFQWSPPTSLL